jgi:hypothetical protein
MSDLLIRDVPEALRQEIAEAAKTKGQSLSSAAIDLLREGLLAKHKRAQQPRRSAWEMLRSAFAEDGEPDGEFAKIMDEIEAERKRDFGRPLPFGSDDDR